MRNQNIIIADRDIAYRLRMASLFRKQGYHVEATGSADHLFLSIPDQHPSVLLLGSDFHSRIASEDLVPLLKNCGSQLQIILVSDQMTLAQARRVRQEDVFYHALKSATTEESEELCQAVACAFVKQARTAHHPAHVAQPEPAVSTLRHFMNALPWLVSMAALVLGTNLVSLPTTNRSHGGDSFAVWMFLGFCALIVIGQIMPIFRVKLELRRVQQRQTAGASEAQGGK